MCGSVTFVAHAAQTRLKGGGGCIWQITKDGSARKHGNAASLESVPVARENDVKYEVPVTTLLCASLHKDNKNGMLPVLAVN